MIINTVVTVNSTSAVETALTILLTKGADALTNAQKKLLLNYDEIQDYPSGLSDLMAPIFDTLTTTTANLGTYFKNTFGMTYSFLDSMSTWANVDALSYENKRKLYNLNSIAYYLGLYADSADRSFILGHGGMAGIRANSDFMTSVTSNSAVCDLFRNNCLNYMYDSNTLFYTNVSSQSISIPSYVDFVTIVGIGAGGPSSNVAAQTDGGAGGAYIHKVVTLTSKSGTCTVNHSGTSLTLNGSSAISLGVGGGAAAHTTPDQTGKLVPVSTHGQNGNEIVPSPSQWSGYAGGAGGGGYGGGGGGVSYYDPYSPNIPEIAGTGGGGGYGGGNGGDGVGNSTTTGGGTGSNFFPASANTGGAAGTKGASKSYGAGVSKDGLAGTNGGGGSAGMLLSPTTSDAGIATEPKSGQGGIGCLWIIF